jgi:hypothetical protein
LSERVSSRALVVLLTIAVVTNALWTPFTMFFALLAESGGKHPSYAIAALDVWALVEIIRTWRWGRRASRGDAAPSRRRLYVGVAAAVLLVLRPAIELVVGDIQPWERSSFALLALVIGACYWLRRYQASATP